MGGEEVTVQETHPDQSIGMRVVAVVVVKDGGFAAAAVVIGVGGVVGDVGGIVGVGRGHAEEGPDEEGDATQLVEREAADEIQQLVAAHPLRDRNADRALPRAGGFVRDPQYHHAVEHHPFLVFFPFLPAAAARD